MEPELVSEIKEILEVRRKIDFLAELQESLEEMPSKIQGTLRYRFATFTAREGLSIMDQFTEHEAMARRSGGSGGVGTGKKSGGGGGPGGSAKFPKIQDLFFRQFLPKQPEVEKGWIRQYFVFVDRNMKAKMIPEPLDIPEELFDYRAPRELRGARPHMLRLSKFETTSLKAYLLSLRRNYQSRVEPITKPLSQMVRKRDASVSGAENFASSLSRMSSSGGVLVAITRKGTLSAHRPEHTHEMRFCPECVGDWMTNLDSSLSRKHFDGIPFPPIPNISLPLKDIKSLCTENKHTGENYDHSFAQCRDYKTLEKIANHYREQNNLERHSTIEVTIELGSGEKNPPWRWAWIRIDKPIG